MTYLRLAVLLFGAMLAQWWMSTYAWAPMLLLVLTIAVSARLGPSAGMACGFVWGLFLDVLRPHLFGGNALLFTLGAYATGMARRQIDVVGVGPQTVMVFVMTWLYFAFMGVLGLVFSQSFSWPGWRTALLTPLYNCVLVPFVFVYGERYLGGERLIGARR